MEIGWRDGNPIPRRSIRSAPNTRHGFRLRDAVAKLPAKRLDAKTIWLIQGAAAHDLYHAGQIKLLLRLLKG
jgi:hypothetical protein